MQNRGRRYFAAGSETSRLHLERCDGTDVLASDRRHATRCPPCRQRKGPALVHAKVIRPYHTRFLTMNGYTGLTRARERRRAPKSGKVFWRPSGPGRLCNQEELQQIKVKVGSGRG